MQSPGGGALRAQLPLFRLGLGGRVGSGRQYVSWVAIDDVGRRDRVRAGGDDVSGPANVSARAGHECRVRAHARPRAGPARPSCPRRRGGAARAGRVRGRGAERTARLPDSAARGGLRVPVPRARGTRSRDVLRRLATIQRTRKARKTRMVRCDARGLDEPAPLHGAAQHPARSDRAAVEARGTSALGRCGRRGRTGARCTGPFAATGTGCPGGRRSALSRAALHRDPRTARPRGRRSPPSHPGTRTPGTRSVWRPPARRPCGRSGSRGRRNRVSRSHHPRQRVRGRRRTRSRPRSTAATMSRRPFAESTRKSPPAPAAARCLGRPRPTVRDVPGAPREAIATPLRPPALRRPRGAAGERRRPRRRRTGCRCRPRPRACRRPRGPRSGRRRAAVDAVGARPPLMRSSPSMPSSLVLAALRRESRMRSCPGSGPCMDPAPLAPATAAAATGEARIVSARRAHSMTLDTPGRDPAGHWTPDR